MKYEVKNMTVVSWRKYDKIMILMKRISIALFILLVLTLFLSSCFLQFRTSDEKAMKEYSKQGIDLNPKTYEFLSRKIHYVEAGNLNAKKVLFFVHGSPGSWNAYDNYLKDSNLLRDFHLISVDRPGYGYSDFGIVEESLLKQSIVYAPILKELHEKNKEIILVGHSYGGPVIARMAMDFADVVKGLIFIAASIDPELEPHYWIQDVAKNKFVKSITPSALIVSNEEILALKNELNKIKSKWKNIDQPVIFIQGAKDDLVHPNNRLFAEKMMINTKVNQMYYEDLDHFIPFTQKQIVIEAIYKMQGMLNP